MDVQQTYAKPKIKCTGAVFNPLAVCRREAKWIHYSLPWDNDGLPYCGRCRQILMTVLGKRKDDFKRLTPEYIGQLVLKKLTWKPDDDIPF